ncbi:MAG: DUF4493 domain-containing protein, partial [Muribaculaceae bacterium]|nr:DUF4493 domain-containing protein [Muribaculaceae bacterium]
MKLYKGIIFSLASLALLSGCANEDPFSKPTTLGETGVLMTRCLSPRLTNPDGYETATRATVPSSDEFNVVIKRKNTSGDDVSQGSVEYKYSDMPEVLTLPVGDYTVSAHHGDNKVAAWEEPYYYGESSFSITANKITDNVEPIVAKLANIRVTIVFSSKLLNAMSGDDNKVEVRVGNQAMMTFTPSETRSAYFKYVNQSQTLAATFTGIVEGAEVVEAKTFDNVAPGNHYRITFRLHTIEPDKPGTVDGAVSVDATVEQVDMNHSVDGEEEQYYDDDWRPGGNGGGGEGPDDPTPDEHKAPQITAAQPDDDSLIPVDLEKENMVEDDTYCVLNVQSFADGGIQEFNVEIISQQLNADELSGMGLSDKLDLVNPGSLEDPLKGLGFPVNVGGEKSVSFNI